MRKKSALFALMILALGLVGIGLSTLYMQEGYSGNEPFVTVKRSYGFPFGWYGYSFTTVIAPVHVPEIYWFSLGSLLLDAAFWFAISFFVSIAAIKSARALNLIAKTRAGMLGLKTSIMLLVVSLSLMVIGVGLCLLSQRKLEEIIQVWFGSIIPPTLIRPYLDLGLRLIGSGTIALIATFLVMLRKPRNVNALSKERLVN